MSGIQFLNGNSGGTGGTGTPPGGANIGYTAGGVTLTYPGFPAQFQSLIPLASDPAFVNAMAASLFASGQDIEPDTDAFGVLIPT